MLIAWRAPVLRATRDIDLLAKTSNDLNARMKDFFDVWMLAETSDFRGADLRAAVLATFQKRGTEFTSSPQVFESDFATNSSKQSQWAGFLKRTRPSEMPPTFPDTVASIRSFLGPIHASLLSDTTFEEEWEHPGPWR